MTYTLPVQSITIEPLGRVAKDILLNGGDIIIDIDDAMSQEDGMSLAVAIADLPEIRRLLVGTVPASEDAALLSTLTLLKRLLQKA